MSSQGHTTILMGTAGPLVGSKFDIGTGGLVIGLDKQKRIAVTTDTRELSVGLVRITAAPDGTYALDAIGGGGAVTVDGSPVRKTVLLTRLHVIEVGEGVEFVFRRSTGTPQATPVQPAPSEPPKVRSPGAPVAGGTMVDGGAFGALPAIGRKTPGGVKAPPSPEPSNPPRPPLGTIVDGPVLADIPDPRLRRGQKTPAAQQEAAPSAPTPAKEAPRAPSAVPGPPAAPAPDATLMISASGRPGEPSPYEIMCVLPGMQTYRLKYGDNVVGRSEECDVVILGTAKVLSRRHAIIKVSNDSIEIVDLKGQNGTYVNGKRVDQAPLTVGTSFLLGNIKFALVKA
jgi:hypothetical protein